MNILIIHNYYSTRGGEESVLEFQKALLESKGHQVLLYTRHYDEMKHWLLGKSWGTVTSIFNPKSRKDLKRIIEVFKPEVSILHNLFPIISPSIIPYLSNNGVKVFQVVHNYRLFCPIGIFYVHDHICHKCMNIGREFNCTVQKCNGSFFASFSYSLRAYLTRKLKYFQKVDQFLVLSQFQKNLFIQNGYDEHKITIIPNSMPSETSIPFDELQLKEKKSIGFVGRLTKEKGFYDFIEVAKIAPQYEFHIAGDQSKFANDVELPPNLFFEGFLTRDQLNLFYKKCKVILFLSHWYEGFPMVLLESMQQYTPLIVTNLGVMPEVIQHGHNGFVVNVGDLHSIKEHIDLLFSDEVLYSQMAVNGKKKCEELYSVESYYQKLILTISD